MFKSLFSKKGYTFMELMTVVVVLGILVVLAVPLFSNLAKKKKIEDCNNQKTLIATAVEQAMYGMFDNGKRQKTVKDADENIVRYALDLTRVDIKHKVVYVDDGVIGNGDDAYKGREAFVLEDEVANNHDILGKEPFTLGDIRGGYRPGGPNSDYSEGCQEGYYLKKDALNKVPFYKFLANEEIPVCPFSNFRDEDKSNNYYYYIFWNEAESKVDVVCSCPECNEVD